MNNRKAVILVAGAWLLVLAVLAGVWLVVNTVATRRATLHATLAAYTVQAANPSSTPTWTPAPSATWTSTPLLPSDTPLPTDTPMPPTPTETPLPPTRTPTLTGTPPPAGGTPEPAALTPEPTPTPPPPPTATTRPRPTSTPTPIPVTRLFYRWAAGRGRVLVATTEGIDQEAVLWDPRRQPFYSAAFSPDGSKILLAYRWGRSVYDTGVTLRTMNPDGSGEKELWSMTAVGQTRELGNALWSPDGTRIAMFFYDWPNNGVYIMNADGSDLKRLDNSIPGEWPRYWSVDGQWIVTIYDDGQLYAIEVDGQRRVPLSTLENVRLFDERIYPWRVLRNPRCTQTKDSWWRCW